MALLSISVLLIYCASALARHGTAHHQHSVYKRQSNSLTGQYPQQNFTMPIDHFQNETKYAPHTNATFDQFYWFDNSTYKPGGPVIVNTMGEDGSFDLQWFQNGLLHDLANATGAMAVLWPQRYYSGGNIVPDLQYTTENLRFHSTEQAMADLAYFAQRAQFPGYHDVNLTSPGVPWIVIGGSYAGVISAFSRIQYPDVFWAGIQSSGVSVALLDNWQYYDAVRKYGPQKCVRNQQTFVDIIDSILLNGTAQQIHQLKAAFNATTLTSNADFAQTITYELSSGWFPSWLPGYGSPLTGPGTLCGNMTSQNLLNPVTAAVSNRAKQIIKNGGWANETSTLLNPFLNYIASIRDNILLGYCPPPLTLNDCWSNHAPSPFDYLGCVEAAQFATGYQPGTPGHPPFYPVTTRLNSVSHFIEQCRTTYNLTAAWKGPDLNTYNKYGGFNMSYDRLLLTTGEWDNYRPITPLAAQLQDYGVPNPRLKGNGTKQSPERVIAQGGHEWDLQEVAKTMYNATLPPEQVKSVHGLEIETVQMWLSEWKEAQGGS